MNLRAAHARLRILSTVVLLTLWLVPAVARAAVPNPPNSVYEPILFACPSGAGLPQCPAWPSPERGFQVVVRDVANVPLAGVVVTLDISASGLVMYPDFRPGTVFNCAAGTISRRTDGAGQVTFAARLGGVTPTPEVLISADGVILGRVAVRTPDYNGNGLVDVGDFARFTQNYNQFGSPVFTDLDGCTTGPDGPTTIADFAIFAQEFLTQILDQPCP